MRLHAAALELAVPAAPACRVFGSNAAERDDAEADRRSAEAAGP